MPRPAAAEAMPVAIAGAVVVAAVASALALRPLLPVDETRYTTVAWEMWSQGSLLVPHLNAEPYAHKPPLLFWMIQLLWSAFGVSATAARTVSGAFAIATLAVTAWIARRLWPEDMRTGFLAPLMLAGMPVFLTFGSLVMFDVVLAFFTTLGLAAVLALAAGARARWWVLYAVCFGAGIVTKGPVAALFLLPAPLLAPFWWAPDRAPGRRRWYVSLALAAAGGIAIGLAWAVPAAIAGGEAYARRLFLRQTVERVAGGLGHPRPWWFYLAVMPVLLYPWGWIPATWRGMAAGLRTSRELWYCLSVALPAVLILSVVHGKQLHYLVPALPFVILIFARGLSSIGDGWRRADRWLPLALPAVIGLALLASPLIVTWVLEARGRPSPQWLNHLSPLWGIVLLVVAIAPVAIASVWRRAPIEGIVASMLAIFVTIHFAGNAAVFHLYDLKPVARYVHAHPAAPIAMYPRYNGEFGFLSRLKRPVEYVTPQNMPEWLARHENGIVVYRYRKPPSFLKQKPVIDRPYFGHRIGVWDAGSAREKPAGGRP